MYKSKDDENISRTMQDKKMEQKKSGIYMDRMDGALPQNRVSKYYQDTMTPFYKPLRDLPIVKNNIDPSKICIFMVAKKYHKLTQNQLA